MSRSIPPLGLMAALMAAPLLTGCAEDVGTSVRISLVYKDSWRMATADVVVTQQDESNTKLESSAEISHELLVLVPDSLAGNVMPLEVWGVRDNQRISHGSAVALVRKGETVEATIVLDRLPCGVFCAPGDVQCDGSGSSTCEEDEDGCLQWSQPQMCPSEFPFCSGGVCGISCADECVTGEGQCVDAKTSRACGEYDNDACLDFGPQVKCSGAEVCYSGRCAAPCTHGVLINNVVAGSAGAATPVVAVDAAGGVHAVYSEAGTRQLRYAFRTKTGAWPSSWDLVGSAAGENPSLLVDKAGGIHVLAGGAAVTYAYRPPATTTWQVAPPLETGTAIGVASSLGMGEDGVLHAVYHRASDQQLRYATKVGTSWTIENAGDPGPGARCDLVMVGNTPHVSSFDSVNDLWHSTRDPEEGWTSTLIESLLSATLQSIAGSAIAAGRDGTLHVVYSDLYPNSNQLRYLYRPAGGSWTTSPIIIDSTGSVAGATPDLSIDPFDRLHAISRTTSTTINPVLRYATKDEGMTTWSLAVQPSSLTAVSPSIAIDSLGNVHILSASTSVIETMRACQ